MSFACGSPPRCFRAAADECEAVRYDRELFRTAVDGRDVDLLDAIKHRPVPRRQLYRLGQILADLILPGKVRERFLASLIRVTSLGQRLRLRLLLEGSDLKTLPWEYIYLPPAPNAEPDWSGFLALNNNVSIVRHEAIDAAEPPTPRGGKYRMVAALASPKDQDPLNLSADRTAIMTAIANVGPIGTLTPVWVHPATRRALEDSLKDECDIFHFSGHGLFYDGQGEIILEDPKTSDSDAYPADNLSQLLRDSKAKIAILSACETGGRSRDNAWGGVAANLVINGLAAVVASQFRLRDANALALTEELYPSLLSGKEIDEGIYEARKRMHLNWGIEDRDWGALVLYLRAEGGVIFPHVDRRANGGPRIAPTPLQTPLVGRAPQIAQLRPKLQPGGNLFFYGSYGVGKTSLAIELFGQAASDQRLARGYVWGRFPGTSAEHAIEWLAANFPGQQVARANGLAEKVEALRQLLAGTPGVLIALDDVRNSAVAKSILDASGSCAVLINGDRRLNLGGAAEEVEVLPLGPSDAESLFMSLAKIEVPHPQRDLVRKICARMGHLPLGIKLAALKYAEGESLNTLWSRLESSVDIADENVRVLFDANFEELQAAPVGRRLLVRIAAFPAFEAPLDALRVDEDDAEFFQAKDKLIALGLVIPAGPDRLAHHPLLAPLSLKKASRRLVREEKRRVAAWLTEYAKTNRRDFPALHREQDNLLGLLDTHRRSKDWGGAIGLMQDLFDFLRMRGLWRHASDRLDQCLQNEAKLTDSDKAWVFLGRAIIRTLMSLYEEALSDLSRAENCYRNDNDGTNLGRVRYRRGVILMLQGNLSDAAKEFAEGLEHMDVRAASADVSGARARLGAIFAQQGHVERALSELTTALNLAESENEYEEQARVHIAIGSLNEREGKRYAAADHFQRALTLATQLDDRLQAAQIVREIGDQHYNSGRFNGARARFQEAIERFRALGYQPGVSRCLHVLGNVALAEKNFEAARQFYNDALALNLSLGLRGATRYNRYQLAVLAHRQHELSVAEAGYQQVLEDAKLAIDRVLEGAALAQLSKLPGRGRSGGRLAAMGMMP
jgi:tetratricopeptide (TPR) repeat protein